MTIPSLRAATAALLLATACVEPGPGGPSLPRPDAHPADRSHPAASVAWNGIAGELVRSRGANVFQSMRAFATLHRAQHHAVVSAEVALDGARPLSRRAAAAAASVVALSYLFPADAAALEAELERQLALPGWVEAGSPDVAGGVAVGRVVGAKVVAHARTDRMFDPWTGTVPTGPGMWYSSATPPAPPGGAGFSAARPFYLTSTAQFRPAPPPAYGSPAFQAALAEVRRITDARTPAQDSIAKFWATFGGRFEPSGFWNHEAATLVAAQASGERRASHLLALTSMAMVDALLACNDAKYTYWLLRPSQADPGIGLAVGLPNFPAYPSNHACISVAAAEVLGAGIPAQRARLSAMAEEAAISRVYGGIHYRFDGDVGLALGRQVARHAMRLDRGEHQAYVMK